MIWKMFCLSYELHSPLHIGYHKVGNVQRTRYYIPARNLWGAVTECLTRGGFSPKGVSPGDYEKIGEWVGRHLSFSYFFLLDEAGKLLVPRYGQKGLKMGELPLYDFERCYLDSHVTTALDASTTSAEKASLHEVEFITPYRLRDDEAHRTQLSGRALLDEVGTEQLGDEGKWRKWLGELQVGGERRYGFGRLRLMDLQPHGSLVDFTVQLNEERPHVKVPADGVLLAHAVAEEVEARGMVEPVVGRETSGNSSRFGTKLTTGRVCWVPGSVVNRETSFQISETGIWSKIS